MTSSENEDFESADEEIEEKIFSIEKKNPKEYNNHTGKNQNNIVNKLEERNLTLDKPLDEVEKSNRTSNKPLDERKTIECDGWEAPLDELEVDNLTSNKPLDEEKEIESDGWEAPLDELEVGNLTSNKPLDEEKKIECNGWKAPLVELEVGNLTSNKPLDEKKKIEEAPLVDLEDSNLTSNKPLDEEKKIEEAPLIDLEDSNLTSNKPLDEKEKIEEAPLDEVEKSNITSNKPLVEDKKIESDGWEVEDEWGANWEEEIENVSSELGKTSIVSEKTSKSEKPEIAKDNEHDTIEDSEETKIKSDFKDEKENNISNVNSPISSGWLGGGWGSSFLNAASSISQTLTQENASNDQASMGFGSLISGVTKLVEQTSSAVISGGLDTLETIGKKTMEVLQDGDPGLKKKRAVLFSSDRPILSQVLRDAKLKAAEEEKFQTQNNLLKQNVYEVIFDEEQGLVHLEALEMLSKQSELRIQTRLMSSTGSELKQLQNEMQKIREVVDNYSEQDDQNKDLTNDDALIEASLVIGNSAAVQKFLQRYSELREKGAEVKESVLLDTQEVNESENVEEEDEEEKIKREIQEKANRKTQQEAIRSLAILSASAMDLFHKSAELILVEPKTGNNEQRQKEIIRKTIAFVQISELLGSFLNETAKEFSEILSSSNASNEIISNLFLDAESSASCIQEALQLCIPILQEHGLF